MTDITNYYNTPNGLVKGVPDVSTREFYKDYFGIFEFNESPSVEYKEEIFNPDVWLDASDIGVADGGDITSWSDKAGNVTLDASGSRNPILVKNKLNGHPCISFPGCGAMPDGSSYGLFGYLKSPLSSPEKTIILAGYHDQVLGSFFFLRPCTFSNGSDPAATSIIESYYNESTQNMMVVGDWFRFLSASKDYVVDHRNTGETHATRASSPAVYILMSRWSFDPFVELLVNGVSKARVIPPVTGPQMRMDSLSMQSLTEGGNGAGYFSELLIYDRLLSDMQAAQITNHFRVKYGI